jgi:SNF2 family DNA or RNA helicase
MNTSIPSYLREVEEKAHHYYGELSYDKYSDSWVIKGEPVVCQYAKRIFPGSSGKGSGEARFKRNKRFNADLNWLMQRFPLTIVDKDMWNDDHKEAVDHVMKRIDISNKPKKLLPSDQFQGELREFQKESLAFVEQNNPTLLALEMGLGKTVISLAWISRMETYPGIIVVPKNIVGQWKESIMKFMNLSEERVHIITGLTPYDLPDADFYIIHYGLLRGWKNELPSYGFEFLVFDEIQELRHRGTEKYSAASLLAESVDKRIGMSGTPIYNSGGEIWNIINILEYHCLGDWDSFTREWCYGYGNETVSDPGLLGEYLKREGLMLRMTKKEVLDELPDKRRVVFAIDSDEKTFNREISNALTLVSEFDKTEDNLKKGRLKRLIDTETRKATGLAKAKDVADFVKMIVEAGEKVVLYGWHHEVYEEWKKHLKVYNPAFITGRENDKQKKDSKDKFVSGSTPVLIISLRAAAGLDGLQESACVSVFGELDWSPGVHAQCEDRLHRIGQKDSVLSYYPVASQGQDEEMMEHLGFKTAQFVGIMGDQLETEDDKMLAQVAAGKHIEKVIDKLRSKIKN